MHLDSASLHLGRGHAPYTAKNKDGLPRASTRLPCSFPLLYKISHAPRFRFAPSRSRACALYSKKQRRTSSCKHAASLFLSFALQNKPCTSIPLRSISVAGMRPIQQKTKTDFLVQARGFRLCFCCAWLILFRISCRRHLQGLGRYKHFHSGSDQDVHNKSECPDVLYAVSQDLLALR